MFPVTHTALAHWCRITQRMPHRLQPTADGMDTTARRMLSFATRRTRAVLAPPAIRPARADRRFSRTPARSHYYPLLTTTRLVPREEPAAYLFFPTVGAVYDRPRCRNSRLRAVIDRPYSLRMTFFLTRNDRICYFPPLLYP